MIAKDYLLPGIVSCAFALLLTPLIRAFAVQFGIVDAPDGFRKLHVRAMPLGGGLAVLLAVGLTILLENFLGVGWIRNLTSTSPIELLGAGAGAVLISFIGLLDDRFRLRGRHKLMGQIAAGMLAVFGGIIIHRIDLFGQEIELGLLSVPFTLFWLLGAVNALNLIDGVDGLATSVGIVLSLTIAVIAVSMGQVGEAALAVILAGALLGFLPYNWASARIFLGDTGSMLIGFLLGILAIRGSMKGPATVALVAPTALWAIPVFDVSMAILRRKLTGQSIYATDRSHLHHVLQRRGLGQSGTVLVIAGLCAVCGLGAILSVYSKDEFAAIAVVCCVFLLLMVTRSFGHSEFHLLLQGIRRFIVSFLSLPQTSRSDSSVRSRFHGNCEFDEAWQTLLSLTDRYELSSVSFNINAPMLGEVYHSHWQRPHGQPDRFSWTAELPLIWQSHEIGRVAVQGVIPHDESPFLWTRDLMESLKTFETLVLDLFEEEVKPEGIAPVPRPLPEMQLKL